MFIKVVLRMNEFTLPRTEEEAVALLQPKPNLFCSEVPVFLMWPPITGTYPKIKLCSLNKYHQM